MKNNRMLEVGIFSPGNLRIGAGVENLIYNLVINKPKNVNLTIIQTGYLPYQRLDQIRFEQISENARIVTLKLLLPDQINAIRNMPPFLVFLFHQLYMRIYFNVVHFRQKKKLFSGLDIVYLTNNWFYPLFKNKKLVGTQHTDFDYLPSKSGLRQSIKIKLISAGVLFGRISAFHLFPASSDVSKKIKNGKNLILNNGVNLTNYKIGNRVGRAKFLFVGRLEECKGLRFILDLWIKYKIEADLNIVGIGPLYALKDYYSDYQNICFQGRLSEGELLELYSQSDVLLSPTKCDTFSMTITQALASGCQVLVSDFLFGVFNIYRDAGYLHYLSLEYPLWARKIEFISSNIDEIRSNAFNIRQIAAKTNDIIEVSQRLYLFLEKIFSENSKKCEL